MGFWFSNNISSKQNLILNKSHLKLFSQMKLQFVKSHYRNQIAIPEIKRLVVIHVQKQSSRDVL